MAAHRRQTLAQSVAKLMQRFIRVALISRLVAAHWSQAASQSRLCGPIPQPRPKTQPDGR